MTKTQDSARPEDRPDQVCRKCGAAGLKWDRTKNGKWQLIQSMAPAYPGRWTTHFGTCRANVRAAEVSA